MGGYVGFVGLGSMGGRMARNLLTKNIRLAVFDNNKEKLLEFKEKGSNICSSAAELASKCEKIFTMLPNGEDVLSLYAGKEGIMEYLFLFVFPEKLSGRIVKSLRMGKCFRKTRRFNKQLKVSGKLYGINLLKEFYNFEGKL